MKMERIRPQIVLVVGSRNSGKTAYLHLLKNRIQEQEECVGGVVSEAELRDGEKWRYWLRDIRTGKRLLLATRYDSSPGKLQVGRFRFEPETFRWAEGVFRQSLDCDVLFLDEYGPLEARGEGFRHVLEFLLKNYRGILVITLRPSLFEHLINEVLTQTPE